MKIINDEELTRAIEVFEADYTLEERKLICAIVMDRIRKDQQQINTSELTGKVLDNSPVGKMLKKLGMGKDE